MKIGNNSLIRIVFSFKGPSHTSAVNNDHKSVCVSVIPILPFQKEISFGRTHSPWSFIVLNPSSSLIYLTLLVSCTNMFCLLKQPKTINNYDFFFQKKPQTIHNFLVLNCFYLFPVPCILPVMTCSWF